MRVRVRVGVVAAVSDANAVQGTCDDIKFQKMENKIKAKPTEARRERDESTVAVDDAPSEAAVAVASASSCTSLAREAASQPTVVWAARQPAIAVRTAATLSSAASADGAVRPTDADGSSEHLTAYFEATKLSLSPPRDNSSSSFNFS